MNQKTNLKPYLHQFYRGGTWYFALALAQTFLLTAVNLGISWMIQQIIDLISGIDTGFSLKQLVLMAIGCILLEAFVFACAYFSKPKLVSRGIAQYQEYIFAKICQKGIAAFSGENTALYLSALSNDAAVIGSNYISNFFVIADQSLLFAGALALMFYYSPLLTLISVGLSIIPLIISVATGELVAKAEKAVSDANESYMDTLKDSLSGFTVMKAFRAEAQFRRLFTQKIGEITDAKCRRSKVGILVQMLSAFSGSLVQFGVCLIGAYMALTGANLTAGSVLVFVQLLNFVIGPIGTIPQALAERKAARALIKKAASAVEENTQEAPGTAIAEIRHRICLEGLCFAYEQEKPILTDMNFSFQKGRSYAIVGASGSGKSTLMNLLMASSHDYDGGIYLDDMELRDIAQESLYGLISVVQQNVFIFNATIRDNITMFSAFPEEALERAIRLSGLEQLVRERGEHYLCGENGCALSGGEKQRISIARSLLRQSQVLLMDEATAALDTKTAFAITNAILSIPGITKIVVTHSLEEGSLRQFDCILTLKNGKIIEQGSFDALMAGNGYFRSLYTVAQ